MNISDDFETLLDIKNYYADRIKIYGATPQGVDWNGKDGQILRFEQLGKIIHHQEFSSFSVNDLGCGYGALFDYLKPLYPKISYHGYDISSEMIYTAHQRYGGDPQADFFVSDQPSMIADYGIASGIFNVHLGADEERWRNSIEKTLDFLNSTSRLGFSFNCLTSYADQEKMQKHLYYADPCVLFDLCKRRYGRDVALLHDYGLYEFTILVRKS